MKGERSNAAFLVDGVNVVDDNIVLMTLLVYIAVELHDTGCIMQAKMGELFKIRRPNGR